ncbi:hypothetical protein Tco_0952790 [Tanacetum coccineum]|uniref:Uncharacterized protein n=1 Tax=Tanacetum coccineum TaxID=301880 RepID=A0ABQ5DY03_9ASTR
MAYSDKLNTAYLTFITNTAYLIQQTNTTYSNKLNTAYRSPDIKAETDSSYLTFVLDFLYFLSSEPILLIVYPVFQLFKTPSLDKSSSPEFDLFSNLEGHFEEEVAGTMMETMEEYMCKTRDNALSFPYVPYWSRESLAKEQTIWFNQNLERSEDEISKQEVILFYNGLEVPMTNSLIAIGAHTN